MHRPRLRSALQPFRWRGRLRQPSRGIARAYAPALAWGLAVFVIGGLPQVPVPVTQPGLDKVGHFGMYGLLGALLAWGWLRAGRRPAAYWLVLAASLLGAVDELRQGLMATRSAEVGDWIADTAGAIAGFAFVVGIFGRKRTERK